VELFRHILTCTFVYVCAAAVVNKFDVTCLCFMEMVCFLCSCESKVCHVLYIVYRFDPDGEFWHSSLITKRLHRRVVCSSTGTTYKLVGKLVKPLALAQGGKQCSLYYTFL